MDTSTATPEPIQDPDPLINCDLMDGRDAFPTMARDRHYELHNQGTDKYVYTCNSCKWLMETRYHCTVCDDFDLCVPCHEKEGHQHKMEKFNRDNLDFEVGASPGDLNQANQQEAARLSIERFIQSMMHACQCRDAICRLPSCQKIKRILTHSKICKRKTKDGCPICKQLVGLCCYHAKHCQESKCLVPFCSCIKQKLKQPQVLPLVQQAKLVQQVKLLRRRMAAMKTRAATSASSPLPPALASPLPSKPLHHADSLPHNVQ